MKATTIENHTNPKPAYNCTHLQAWLLGYAVTSWGWHNLLHWFRPPVLESVAIVPQNKDLVDPDDIFEPYMFQPKGTFFDVPLNNYLRLSLRGYDGTFLINAGFLLNQFMISRRNGFTALKDLLQHAKEELIAPFDSTKDSDPGIQEEVPSERG